MFLSCEKKYFKGKLTKYHQMIFQSLFVVTPPDAQQRERREDISILTNTWKYKAG